MKHPYYVATVAFAASLSLVSSAMAQMQQQVDIMITILLDQSSMAVDQDCTQETTHAEALRSGLQEMLNDEDVVPRNSTVALGVYYYGTAGTVGQGFCNFVCEAYPITLIEEGTTIGLGSCPGAATGPYLHNAMMCVGTVYMEAAADDFDATKKIMLVIPHGEHVGEDPALARETLLYGADPYVHEINGLACQDGTFFDTAEAYLAAHVIGDTTYGDATDSQRLPYVVGQGDGAVTRGCFYSIPTTPCPVEPISLERYRLQLQILTRVVLSRCLYDVAGIEFQGTVYGDGMVHQPELGMVLAAYDTQLGDPLYDPLADLNQDTNVDQSDLGLLLGTYGCGSHFAY